MARLDPEAQRHQEARQAVAARSVQLAALDAFASQGPRLALVLDAFRLAPDDLALHSLRLTTSPSGTWRLRVDGQTRSSTAANAQASFSMFVKSASASKYLGVPTRSPEISIHIEEARPVDTDGRGGRGPGTAATAVAQAPPPLFIGTILDFALNFEVNK
jgi:hypothetical protein